ncbi:putative retrotransposon gag domain-containing protein [Helianthus annuus]|nr:putative retrotransposon gag domain-containing protein [Helianthus annuus]
MSSSSSRDIKEPLEEPKRFLRKRLKAKNQEKVSGDPFPMADQRTLMDYLRPTIGNLGAAINAPNAEAKNFELRPYLIQMLQNSVTFHGLADEDPHLHITNFLEICDTFRINGASNDAIRLRMFPFSLKDRAKAWLNALPVGSVNTWDELAQKFLYKYFPPAKTAKLMTEINTYSKEDGESLYETWERFKELLRKCSHHGLAVWQQVSTFYNGLLPHTRQTLDSSSEGLLGNRRPHEIYNQIKEIAQANFQWHTPRGNKSIAPGAHKVDESTSLQDQVEALSSKIKKLEMAKTVSVMACEGCGGPHENWSCMKETDDQPESVNYIDNRPRPSGPPTDTYNQGWRNHPNLGWREPDNSSNQQNLNQRTNFQQPRNESQNFPQQQGGRERLEDTVSRLISDTEKKNSDRFQQSESNFRNQQASIRKH